MICKFSYLGTALLFAVLSVVPATAAPSKVESREIRSANFAQSSIGTTPVRKMAVYLPAGYDDVSTRYPVIYFFPDAFAGFREPFDHKGARLSLIAQSPPA